MSSSASRALHLSSSGSSRYDYRTVWLHFVEDLTLSESCAHDLATRIVDAVLMITGCRAGSLWHVEADATFHWRAARGLPAPRQLVVAAPAVKAALGMGELAGSITQLAATMQEALPPWLVAGPAPWAFVTLRHRGAPLALMVLHAPPNERPFDDGDQTLLALLGSIAACYLAEAEARETLAELQALNSFNRRVAAVLHDIKNVAAKLSLALDNARRLRDNPEFYEDLLGTVAHAVRRLETVRARLEAQPAGARHEPVPLHRLVRQACARVGPILHLHEPLPELWLIGDPALLEAAISNLLANAREAAGEHGWIRVRLERRGHEAVLEVQDSGPGLSPELARRGLFRPFATSRRGGTGLGLIGVRDAVRRSGGQIEIETGDGTLVRLRLPWAELQP